MIQHRVLLQSSLGEERVIAVSSQTDSFSEVLSAINQARKELNLTRWTILETQEVQPKDTTWIQLETALRSIQKSYGVYRDGSIRLDDDAVLVDCGSSVDVASIAEESWRAYEAIAPGKYDLHLIQLGQRCIINREDLIPLF